jgi:hypothetical protein
MKMIVFYTLIILSFILRGSTPAMERMESTSYQISSSVISGGGEPMSSSNYQTNSTLGQASPLMDQDDPFWSGSYDIYPGFWFTLSYTASFADLDEDGDVDGNDLAEFSRYPFNELELEEFAEAFGRTDQP